MSSGTALCRDEFGEPLELQHRYEALELNHNDLVDQQKRGLKDLRELKDELRKLQVERSTQNQVRHNASKSDSLILLVIHSLRGR